ncbi:MAG: lipase maturation factor family protein, partial [Chthoniobacterales bacterium]|nr:lipase maturation factor family protein [Chthoniobacterales bacterium]
EIVVPFFIWAPRCLRHIAAVLLITLQIAIAITGNYCFFNLVTLALCVVLFDDSVWTSTRGRELSAPPWRWGSIIPATVLFMSLPLNLWLTYSAFERRPSWPKPMLALYSRLEPFCIANGYGLFRVMTKERPEIVFEGSADDARWQPYEFNWKPGDLNRPPQWNAPHQPRLDWSMWFAALGSRRDRFVVESLAAAMLRNNPAVLHLLAANPFPNAPPRSVRATLYQYRFTTAEERRRTGAWWARDDGVELLPEVTLQDLR